MDDDYYSVESILAENQKVQCTFKVPIQDMGHLAGGTEPHVRPLCLLRSRLLMFFVSTHLPDQTRGQDPDSHVDGIHPHLLVRSPRCHHRPLPEFIHYFPYNCIPSDYAGFAIPPPFSARVRNALKADARSVKLANLVGQGGVWYSFGRMIMRLYVLGESDPFHFLYASSLLLTFIRFCFVLLLHSLGIIIPIISDLTTKIVK